MKKLIAISLVAALLAGCSTAGGIYKRGDAENGEFSLGKTLLSVIAVAGAVAVVRKGGGGSYAESGYAWDYQPGNGQWVCRDKSNGRYAYKENCAGAPVVDHWR